MRLILSIVAVFAIANWLPSTFHSDILQAVLGLPGTFLHEVAHYGFALLLDGHPGTFSILPTWSGGRMDTLGHVTFYPNWYNAATVGLAPFLVLPASIWLMVWGSRRSLLVNMACIYAAACGYYACTPSSADLSIAYSQPQSFLVAVPILLGSCYIWYRLILASLRPQSRTR